MREDNEEYKREVAALQEYEEHFKAKLAQFEQELDDLEQLETYLNATNEKIELTVNEKKACLDAQYQLRQEKSALLS